MMMKMWNVFVVVEALPWHLLLIPLLLLNPTPHFAGAITAADYASLEANETEIDEQVNWHINFHQLLHNARFQLSPKINAKQEKQLEDVIAGYPSPDQILEMKKEVVSLGSVSLSVIVKELSEELPSVNDAIQEQQYLLWQLQKEQYLLRQLQKEARTASLVADEANAKSLVRVCKENIFRIRVLFLQSGWLLNRIKSERKLASRPDLKILSQRIVGKIVKLRNHTEELLAAKPVPKSN